MDREEGIGNGKMERSEEKGEMSKRKNEMGLNCNQREGRKERMNSIG